MNTKKIDVRIGLTATPVGALFFETSGDREVSKFVYHASWLANRSAFAVSPTMPLGETPFYCVKEGNASALPGPIADGTPDSWGRAIVRSAMGGRVSSELDYLIETDDELRSGALRYFDTQGDAGRALAVPKNNGGISIPRLLDLERVIAESKAFEADPIHYREHRAKMVGGNLLKDAVGSLGGARPKVNAFDREGNLWIVKLAKFDDEYAMARAEVLALRLAKSVGITVANAEVLTTSQRFPVAIIRRFDRIKINESSLHQARVPFISAQTFLGLRGTEPGNYVDLAQEMRIHCNKPKEDIQELFRRITYNVLIQNTDDHLRNHGFLMSGRGKWSLSPAFDINPVPEGGTLKTAISELHGNKLSIAAVIDAAQYFDISEDEGRQIALKMAESIVSNWKSIASELGMTKKDLMAIAPALENIQIKEALALGHTMVKVSTGI